MTAYPQSAQTHDLWYFNLRLRTAGFAISTSLFMTVRPARLSAYRWPLAGQTGHYGSTRTTQCCGPRSVQMGALLRSLRQPQISSPTTQMPVWISLFTTAALLLGTRGVILMKEIKSLLKYRILRHSVSFPLLSTGLLVMLLLPAASVALISLKLILTYRWFFIVSPFYHSLIFAISIYAYMFAQSWKDELISTGMLVTPVSLQLLYKQGLYFIILLATFLQLITSFFAEIVFPFFLGNPQSLCERYLVAIAGFGSLQIFGFPVAYPVQIIRTWYGFGGKVSIIREAIIFIANVSLKLSVLINVSTVSYRIGFIRHRRRADLPIVVVATTAICIISSLLVYSLARPFGYFYKLWPLSKPPMGIRVAFFIILGIVVGLNVLCACIWAKMRVDRKEVERHA